jgi:phage anti-repressor protein
MSEEVINVTNQTPIEVALQIDEDGFTTAKKLYKWLELSPQHYSDWCKKNILENEFATEDEDYKINSRPKGSLTGRGNTTDYKLSASFAKKLSMQQKNERGEQARNYFIGCEQALVRLAEQKHKTELERAKGIAVRQALTKALQQSNENDRMHGHAYSTYTNLIYKSIFGKDAKHLREEYGISKKDELRDCFSAEELQQVQKAEMLVSSLVEYGWGYDEIKDFILNKLVERIAA